YCNGVGEGNQAPFKISSDGEKVYLSNKDGFCDRIKIPGDLPADSSYGRKDGEWMYFDNPAPGKENGEGYAARTSIPSANYLSGVYTEALQVSLFGEGTIYYTIDGSKPTTSSKVYNNEITVTDIMTIRTMAVKDGRESEEAAYTYVINKEHSLPILVLSGPYETTLGPNGVVALNKKGSGIEAEVMMTLIENGEEKFSVPCGITLSGNNGGSRDADKRNFNVFFRSAYGVGKLKYKVFDDLDIESFNSLRLKGGAEDWEYAIIRDEFMTHMTIGNTALCAQASKPVVLYLAGEYWGIYFIRERFSADYVATHYDVSKDSVDLLQGYVEMVEEGSKDDYDELVSFVKSHDLSVDENYDYVASRIDLDSLMDWYICRSYMGDKDPDNIRYFRSTEGDNKWRWMFFDLDWGFYHEKDDPLTWQLESSGVKNRNTVVMFRKIIQSPRGKDAFLKRYAYLMDTILNEEYITKELDYWKGLIESEIPADRARWKRSVSGWNTQMQKLYDYVKDGKRDKNVLRDIKTYFKLSDDQMKSYFGDKWNP
ncbi:MAG: CotH kinase family protein, partial [Lachnospiraceae bacterium]|nr:CotH kinase family protein [Lachnospiraceae bacterium]